MIAEDEAKKASVIFQKRIVTKKGFKTYRPTAKPRAALAEAIAPGFPPTPQEDLVFRGGRTIQNLSFVNFYVAGQTAWNVSDIQKIDQALSAAMSDQHLNNVMMQYFNNQPITSRLLGSQRLPGNAPAVVSQGDAEALVGQLAQQGAIPGADVDSTVVNLLLPRGTVLTTDVARTHEARATAKAGNEVGIPTEDEESSTDGLGGYHGSVHLTIAGVAKTVYYAVGVFSEATASGENGIVAFDEPWKNVVATFYHELNEARTDPDVEDTIRTRNSRFLGWTSNNGNECGDFPIEETAGDLALVFQEVPLANGSGTVPIQFQYSNAVHGPEGRSHNHTEL